MQGTVVAVLLNESTLVEANDAAVSANLTGHNVCKQPKIMQGSGQTRWSLAPWQVRLHQCPGQTWAAVTHHVPDCSHASAACGFHYMSDPDLV